MSDDTKLYRVIFLNQDKVYELYVNSVGQSDMWGFLELRGFEFGSRSDLLVDPSEEKLKQEFGSVDCSYVPMHSVIRIDTVSRQGVAKVTEAKGNVMPFPIAPPPRKS